MSDWDDDDGDDEEDLFFFTQPSWKLPYSEWKNTMLSLGFSEKEFFDFWDDLVQDQEQDAALEEVHRLLKRTK